MLFGLFRLDRVIHTSQEVRDAQGSITTQASVIVAASAAPDMDPTPLTGTNGQPMARRLHVKIGANGPNAKWLQSLQPGDTFIVSGADMRPGRIVQGETYSKSYTDAQGQAKTAAVDVPPEYFNARIKRVEVSNRQAQEQLARGERVAAVVEQQQTPAPAAAPAVAPDAIAAAVAQFLAQQGAAQ